MKKKIFKLRKTDPFSAMESEYSKLLTITERIISPLLYETAFRSYSHLLLQRHTKASP